MKSDILKQYLTLRQSLESEKTVLEKGLKEIESILDGTASIPAPKTRNSESKPVAKK